jgi:PPOX class probable FMN-dependent enzyme
MGAERTIDSLDGLREVYRRPAQRSLDKEVDHLDEHCRDFVAHAPFLVLATTDGDGRVDVSPKGGPAGFVAVLDDHRLAIPDMSGNNRLDSMTNIVRAGAASLLLFVPGTDETMRVLGQASISVDPDVLATCPIEGMQANVAIVIDVERAFIHCAKALRRAGLWHPERWPDIADMASPACMLRDHIGMEATVEQSQHALDASYAATTWAMGGAPPS